MFSKNLDIQEVFGPLTPAPTPHRPPIPQGRFAPPQSSQAPSSDMVTALEKQVHALEAELAIARNDLIKAYEKHAADIQQVKKDNAEVLAKYKKIAEALAAMSKHFTELEILQEDLREVHAMSTTDAGPLVLAPLPHTMPTRDSRPLTPAPTAHAKSATDIARAMTERNPHLNMWARIHAINQRIDIRLFEKGAIHYALNQLMKHEDVTLEPPCNNLIQLSNNLSSIEDQRGLSGKLHLSSLSILADPRKNPDKIHEFIEHNMNAIQGPGYPTPKEIETEPIKSVIRFIGLACYNQRLRLPPHGLLLDAFGAALHLHINSTRYWNRPLNTFPAPLSSQQPTPPRPTPAHHTAQWPTLPNMRQQPAQPRPVPVNHLDHRPPSARKGTEFQPRDVAQPLSLSQSQPSSTKHLQSDSEDGPESAMNRMMASDDESDTSMEILDDISDDETNAPNHAELGAGEQ
ncbi:hypothetical protein S7711_11552 [Stachybotrys chartarum IBT 7711]|uniref:Uncharacterized protein n=1 Tax=Stachybotrys chartarum (strain CBS 109288 / IBT 7711) TaxID=1280523 RepID=A0A084B951_STACB|nr:hypothetical protein S7711_11552 [Stachybotrys chartarum IBT 7711]